MQVIQSKTNPSTKLLYILPITSIVVIAILYMAVSIGNALTNVHAEESTLTNGADKSFTVSSDRTITVAISTESIDLELVPSATGQFETSPNPLTITVSTNNPTGYNLNMTTTTTNLTRTAPLSGQTPVIQTLSSSGSFTADNFETNAWGFSLDGTNYQAISLSRQINQTIKEANSSTTDLTFGVKLNNEIPSGSYNTTLTFIATTNPLESNFDTAFDAAGKTQVSYNGNNYYKMQDMSGFICSMVATPTDTTALTTQSTQLIDTRDNSIYWVSKLLDGNCWMTQNLDLNLDSNVALTNTNTDLHSVTSWTPTRSTINSTAYNNTAPGASGGILTYNGSNSPNDSFASGWTNDNTPYSVDPGYRYVVPKEMSGSNTNWWDNGDTFYYCTNQDTTCGGNSENGHYTMGNSYNFAAANATNNVETTLGGSANVVQNKVMPDSICPKGWRLPIDQTTNNEFNTLLGASNYNVTSNFNFAGLNAIRKAPLYFVRSGGVDGGTLYRAGVGSRAWSSTISSSTNGYYLSFGSTDIGPADSNKRFYGFPVRCLARTDLTIEDATYLQDVTPEMRQNTAIGTTTTVLDKRDNNEYTIGKLEDGNIWLLDNLRLDPAALLHQLTPANTNMDPNTPFTLPASSTDKFNDDTAGWTTPGINTSLSNTMSTNGVYQGNIGVFYNYCAASAGTICAPKSSNNDSASYDICPKGWRIPTGGSSGEYQALYAAYNSNYANFQTALRTPLSGYFGNGSAGNQGSNGYFWSSTRGDGNSMYYLVVNASSVYSQGNDWRNSGASVRCVLK